MHKKKTEKREKLMRFGPVSESDEESGTDDNDGDSDSLDYNQLAGLGPINVMTHL